MSIKIEENITLKAYTTMKTGGVARYFVSVSNVDEVAEATQFALKNALPILVLGGGSNMLIDDEGFTGLVILNQLKGIEYLEEDETTTLVCDSGEVFDEVVASSVEHGLWGLENLSAIPGSVGATPVQNVGAYGVEVSQLISQVETYNLVTGEQIIFSNQECNFDYRESFFKTENGKNYFITKVFFKLKKEINYQLGYADLKKTFEGIEPTQKEIREAVITIRAGKFPDWKVLGTAGSFFKNPIISKEHSQDLLLQYPEMPQYELADGMVKIPLGYVLDKVCGLKGFREGKVGLFPAQALVLVNYEDANSTEIKEFAEKIADIVFTKTKIKINPEVSFVKIK